MSEDLEKNKEARRQEILSELRKLDREPANEQTLARKQQLEKELLEVDPPITGR